MSVGSPGCVAEPGLSLLFQTSLAVLLLFGVDICSCCVVRFCFVSWINVYILWTLDPETMRSLETEIMGLFSFFSLCFLLKSQTMGRCFLCVAFSPRLEPQECRLGPHCSAVLRESMSKLSSHAPPPHNTPQSFICCVHPKWPTCIELVFCI